MALEFVECITLRADSVVSYNKIFGLVKRNVVQYRFNKKSTTGLSEKSARRINESIKFLYASTKSKSVYQKSTEKYYKFKINFITLTLSSTQLHTDSEILKLVLEPFLRICRIKYNGFLYVWKAEVQDNGNLHFHLNTNVFIDSDWLRSAWNKCQEKLNYISNSSSSNPNSTDIRAVKNSTDLAGYMSKYLAKGDLYKKPFKKYLKKYKNELLAKQDFCILPKNYFNMFKRKVNIKLWSCSLPLLNPKLSIEGITYDVGIDMMNIRAMNQFKDLDYATIYFNVDLKSPIYPTLRKKYYELIANIKQHEKYLVSNIEID